MRYDVLSGFSVGYYIGNIFSGTINLTLSGYNGIISGWKYIQIIMIYTIPIMIYIFIKGGKYQR